MSCILHMCGNEYLYVSICVYVWWIHMYVRMYTYLVYLCNKNAYHVINMKIYLCNKHEYLYVSICVYVWWIHVYIHLNTCAHISCIYVWWIHMYVHMYTYVYMYTYLGYLCNKQVHICTCVHVVIYSATPIHKHTFNEKHVSYKLMIFERIKWCTKMPKKKIHAKSLYDALELLIFFFNLCLQRLCGSVRFASVVVDLRLKLWNQRSTLLSFLLVDRARGWRNIFSWHWWQNLPEVL